MKNIYHNIKMISYSTAGVFGLGLFICLITEMLGIQTEGQPVSMLTEAIWLTFSGLFCLIIGDYCSRKQHDQK